MKHFARFGLLIASLFFTILFTSKSFAWAGQIDCSYLQDESVPGVRHFANITIMASSEDNLFLKVLTLISSENPGSRYFIKGRKPTKEILQLSNMTFAPEKGSEGSSIELRVLEEPQIVTPPYEHKKLMYSDFTQKVSVEGPKINLEGITLFCGKFETIEPR